jgi:hypothetical protein
MKGDKRMNLQLKLNEFSLIEFLDEAIKNGEGIMTPNVFSLESTTKFTIDDSAQENAHELYEKLVQHGKAVYVNFSSSAIDKELHCIDGHTYLYLSEEDAEEYFEDEEVPEDFQPFRNLQIYEDSSVGYLLKYEDNSLFIQTAVFNVTYSKIEVINDAEVLNKPIELYIQKFMK